MSDTGTPTSSDSRRDLQRVHVTFTVDTPSAIHAANIVRGLVRALADGRERHADLDEARSRLAGWGLTDRAPFQAWEPFESTDIPDLVAEMFPPEPRREDFRTLEGVIDEEGFEGAHDQWRDECLSLAVAASRLPELLERMERSERVRDEISDVLARYPLPPEPRRHDFPAGLFGERINEDAYARELGNWQQRLARTVRNRESALEHVLAENGPRGAYLPAQFQQEWIPRDLIAVSTLRVLLDADPAVTGRILDRDTRQHLQAMLFAGDPDVRILDPDAPEGPELYEGPASEAHRWIPPGAFEATNLDGQGEFRVVVGRSPVGGEPTASAAFPPAEHDSQVLGQLSRILETAPEEATSQELLQQVSALVESTGREGWDPDSTMLERGALLSDLLAQRDRKLGQPPVDQPRTPDGREDPGMTR